MRQTAAEVYAWLAGVAFVSSLGYFAYFYLVELGRRTPPGSLDVVTGALAIDLSLFVAFAAHHSLLARTSAKVWMARWLPAHLERATYVWIASALFFLVCRGWIALPGTVYVAAGGWAWLALSVQAGGVWLIYRSTAALDALELAGIRQVRVAFNAAPLGAPRLQEEGLYRLVRHPLYLGWILLVFGAPTMTASRFGFAVMSTAYLFVAIPFEERALTETFGQQYRNYVSRVRWRVLPGIY